MKAWHVVALVAGAFVVGALVCRPDRSLARAELERDSLRVVADSLEARDARRSADAAAAADSSRRREAAIATLEVQVARSRAAVARLQRFLDSGKVAPRAIVDSIIAGKDDEIRAWVAVRDTMRTLLLTARRQWAAADSLAQSWRGLAIARGIALDNALKHRKWGCVVGAGATIGPAIAGSRSSLFGGAIGVTFSCGWKVL